MLASLKVALIAAIPIEIVNFWVVGYPAGSSGLSSSSQSAALALEWYLLHLPGVIASDRSVFLRYHPKLESAVLFLSGYICTAILVAAISLVVRRFRLGKRFSSRPTTHTDR